MKLTTLLLTGLALLMLAGPLRSAGESAAPSQFKEIRDSLDSGLTITPTLTYGQHTKVDGMWKLTFTAYDVRVKIENKTPWSIQLGNELLIFQVLKDEQHAMGCLIEKGPPDFPSGLEQDRTPGDSYDADNYRSSDGSTTLSGFSQVAMPRLPDAKHKDGEVFGKIDPGKSLTISELMHFKQTYKDEFHGVTRLVLPALIVKTSSGSERFMPYLTFEWTTAQEASSKSKKSSSKSPPRLQQKTLKLVHMDEESIMEWLYTDVPAIDRLLAVNWMAQTEKEHAGPILAGVARLAGKGSLPVNIMSLLKRLRAPDLAPDAIAELGNSGQNAGYRLHCARYLQALNNRDALPGLRKAVEDKSVSEAMRDFLAAPLAFFSPAEARPRFMDCLEREQKKASKDQYFGTAAEIIKAVPRAFADDAFWKSIVDAIAKVKDDDGFRLLAGAVIKDHDIRPVALRIEMGKRLGALKSENSQHELIKILRVFANDGRGPRDWNQFTDSPSKWVKTWRSFAETGETEGAPAGKASPAGKQ